MECHSTGALLDNHMLEVYVHAYETISQTRLPQPHARDISPYVPNKNAINPETHKRHFTINQGATLINEELGKNGE